MNAELGLQFLQSHQPLPPDEELDQRLLDEYDNVRKYFRDNPDLRAVPLLLNSFWKGDGMGIYQLVEDTLAAQDRDSVVASLVDSLANRAGGVAYWSAQIASLFPDARLVGPLTSLLKSGEFDERYVAITALEVIGGPAVAAVLLEQLPLEKDEELGTLLRDVLEGMGASG